MQAGDKIDERAVVGCRGVSLEKRVSWRHRDIL